MKKLKLLFISLLLCFVSTAFAENGVVLLMKDGSTVGFAFSQQPAMKTGSATLTMKYSGGTLQYEYSKVQRAYFSSDVTSTGITIPTTGKSADVTFRFTDNGIDVLGLANGESASLYSIDGKQVAKGVSKGGNVKLAVPQGKQVYIVRTSTGVSYKLVKQ